VLNFSKTWLIALLFSTIPWGKMVPGTDLGQIWALSFERLVS
jgi:hypothetical protein